MDDQETVNQSNRQLKHWKKNSLPEDLLNAVYAFTNRRFNEVWGINRTDITKEMIFSRENISLMDDGKIIGWLGIEPDGELDNGCIERGTGGVYHLQKLVEYAATVKGAGRTKLFALVPLDKLNSALSCLRAGMVVSEPFEQTSMQYSDAANSPFTVTLIKLAFPLLEENKPKASRHSVNRQMKLLKNLHNGIENMDRSLPSSPR